MDSLANYGSDGENSNNSDDIKMVKAEKCSLRDRRASDANYDPVQMDMSEDSNNNNSSGDSESEGNHSPPVSSTKTTQSSNVRKSDSSRTSRSSPSDQRHPNHDSHTSSYRGESKRSDRNERTRHSHEKGRRSSNEDKRHRDSDHRDSKKSRDDDRKTSRDDDRRRDRTSSSSGKEERKEERDKDHHHRDDRRERRRDRDRRHSRTDRTKDRHRDERTSHQKEKERTRSRSRSKERSNQSFRSMSYREEKNRNKLAQLEKLGIELKAPEGTTTTPASLGEQNYYNPLATATQGKYAEQIQKRKLLWANKSKQEDGKGAAAVRPTANTWVGTTFTHDQDGKMTAKFKRLMGIKNETPVTPSPGQKPDILKKQEEMFNNMEQQYEVARATTHTQRGVGLGYASSGYQFPR